MLLRILPLLILLLGPVPGLAQTLPAEIARQLQSGVASATSEDAGQSIAILERFYAARGCRGSPQTMDATPHRP